MRSEPCVALGLMLCTVLSAACGDQGSSPEAFVVGDSVGVEIRTEHRPVWTDSDAWRVDDVPTLRIGGDGSTAAVDFHRIGGAQRLDDGRIVVADAGDLQLRVFDRTGRLLETVGRGGEAPGEFRSLELIPSADARSWAAWDRQQGRVTTMDSGVLRTFGAPTDPTARHRFRPISRSAEGNIAWLGERVAVPGDSAGVRREVAPIVLSDASGRGFRLLDSVPGQEMLVEVDRGGVGRRTLPFSHVPRVALGEESVFVSTGDSYEIRVLDRSGALRRIVRRPVEPAPVTDSGLEEYLDRLLEQLPDELHAGVRADFERLPTPDRLPVHGTLLVDAGGRLWVGDYDPFGVSIAWDVFETDGRWLGTVSTPDDVRVTQVGDDFVLGIRADSLGVESVSMHRLDK